MKPRVLFGALLFLSTVIAHEDAPIPLGGKGNVPVCRGKRDDAPGCIAPPHTTYSPNPQYPKKSRKAHDRGIVLLELVVGTDGRPRDLKVEHTLTPELDQAAIDAVEQWKFTPATRDGQPVAVKINVEVNFKLY